jgi:hypothetical protein
MQFEQFRKELLAAEHVHICMGDLFDKSYVPYWVILKTAEIYLEAAMANPNTVYFIIRGNHDASRDEERKTAFMVLTSILKDVLNIRIVDDEPVTLDGFGVIPWHPIINAKAMVKQHERQLMTCHTVFGHWDVVDFGGDNVIPAAELAELGVSTAYTGHDHVARELTIDGLKVCVTGSMQPYSHAEDPAGNLYVTKPLSEVVKNPEAFKDKCLRVLLAPGESLDFTVDCLQLSTKREGVEDEEETVAVEYDAFDFGALLKQAATEEGLSEDFLPILSSKIDEEKAKAE